MAVGVIDQKSVYLVQIYNQRVSILKLNDGVIALEGI